VSESVQITFKQVRVGDTIRIVKECDDGTGYEHVGKVQNIIGTTGLNVSCCGGVFFAVSTAQGCTVTTRLYLVHRPPTRRAITIDDLKDWQAVPIGTHIEFECADTGSTVSGKLIARTETNSWSITVSGRSFRYLSSIKPGTLFVIEEAKP